MGVDTVRIFALWSQIAPAQRPSGFKPADPNDGHYQWFYVDNAVDRVRAAGMKVTLTVTGPGPAWTSSAPGRRQGQWKPRPSAYAAFATAVAKRYASRVDRYILWNEPNISIWLSPQARCSARPLHAGLAAPLPRAGPRRLPRDRRPRPRRRDRDRRAVAARPAAPQREDGDAPAAVPRRFGCRTDGWQRMTTASAAASSRRPATASRSIPTAGARRPSAAIRTPTTSASRRSATCRPRSTGSSAPRPSGPPARGCRSSSTSTATRPTRPTGSPASSRSGRTSGSSAPPTSPGARRGSSSSRSTCGATSRAARTGL